MGATPVLQREAIEVYDYRCSAGPGDRPFAELHDRFSVAYVRKGASAIKQGAARSSWSPAPC